MNKLALGLKAYKTDFGDYPPSNPANSLAGLTGAGNLVYYLRGPGGSGWGTGGGGLMPITGMKPLRTYGPYFQTTDDMISTQTVNGVILPMGFLDSFKPAGIILYFKFDKTQPLATSYSVTDDGPADATGKTNYGGQAQFNEIAQITLTSTTFRWVSQDFLLMSPGPDGRYGYVTVNSTTGVVSLTTAAKGDGTCDDIFNWD